ncbi:MAG: enoyl-CoA hydratase-related protein, partial [Jatrophihabitans sp.]
ALDMGLVNAVVESDRVLATAHELAARLATGPTAAYAAIKASIAYAATTDLESALAMEGQLQDAMGRTEDHLNATRAFIAKQPLVFEGR